MTAWVSKTTFLVLEGISHNFDPVCLPLSITLTPLMSGLLISNDGMVCNCEGPCPFQKIRLNSSNLLSFRNSNSRPFKIIHFRLHSVYRKYTKMMVQTDEKEQ